MNFNIQNQEIQDWLFSRKWLFYIAGYGRGMNGYFSYSPPNESDYTQTKNSFLVVNEQTSYERVHLDIEPYATWSFPCVALTICEDTTFDFIQYQVDIGFEHKRDGGELETVFKGFIKNLEELLTVFRLLGVQESYLTGNQEL